MDPYFIFKIKFGSFDIVFKYFFLSHLPSQGSNYMYYTISPTGGVFVLCLFLFVCLFPNLISLSLHPKPPSSLCSPSHWLPHLRTGSGSGSGNGRDADVPCGPGCRVLLLWEAGLFPLTCLCSLLGDPPFIPYSWNLPAWIHLWAEDLKELKFIEHLLCSKHWIEAFHLLVSWNGKVVCDLHPFACTQLLFSQSVLPVLHT